MLNAMKPSNRVLVLIPLLIVGISCIPRSCSGELVTGIVSDVEPSWYKITIASQDTLNLTVKELNSTAATIIGVALTLGIAQNFGDTLFVKATVINSTQNATFTYKHVDQGPLYLTVFIIQDENMTVQYQINSSHPITMARIRSRPERPSFSAMVRAAGITTELP